MMSIKATPLVLAVSILSVGCASVSRWESRFTEEEKIQLIYERALRNFEKGKETLEHQTLQKAKEDFEFLLEAFKYDPAKKQMLEIERFYREKRQALQASVAEAKAKNDFLAQVGFYRQLQRLTPNDAEANKFLAERRTEIQTQVEQHLAAGKSALVGKNFQKAMASFRAVLSAYPESEEAKQGLAAATAGYEEAKRIEAEEAARRAEEAARARRRAAQREKEEKDQPVQLAAEEKERLYQAGKAAFDKKDFVSAYKNFTAIGDENYKDTRIYLQRSLSKIKALKLEK
jgi:outer membrane protein assembly factor BamD (BamD/ComL family)